MIDKPETGFAAATPARSTERKPFGHMPDGTSVEAITLANTKGMKATILTLGASVQSAIVPDRAGKPFDFRAPTVIGLRLRNGRDEQLRIGRGYDHNWVVSKRSQRRYN